MKRSSSLYPVLVIVLCGLFLFYKYVLQVFPGIITADLMREFSLDGAALGNLAANYFYAYLVTQLFAGILLDKYSARLIGTLAIISGAVGALLFSRTHDLHLAELARLLMGFGTAFATVCYLKNTAVWFKPQHFAFVSGLLATAAMLGAIAGQTPLALLVADLSWRVAIWYVGIAGLILGSVFLLLVRDHNPVQMQQLQQVKYGISWKDVLQVLKNKQNWALTLYNGLIFTPLAVFGGLWGNPFLMHIYHLGSTQAATVSGSAFLGLAVGAPVFGLISDRLNERKKVMMVGTFAAFLVMLLVIFGTEFGAFTLNVLMFIFGFSVGVFMLCFAVAKESNPLMLAATVVSMINMGDPILGSFTEPLIGKFLDFGWQGQMLNGVRDYSSYDYRIALAVLPLYLILAVFFLRAVKEKA